MEKIENSKITIKEPKDTAKKELESIIKNLINSTELEVFNLDHDTHTFDVEIDESDTGKYVNQCSGKSSAYWMCLHGNLGDGKGIDFLRMANTLYGECKSLDIMIKEMRSSGKNENLEYDQPYFFGMKKAYRTVLGEIVGHFGLDKKELQHWYAFNRALSAYRQASNLGIKKLGKYIIEYSYDKVELIGPVE